MNRIQIIMASTFLAISICVLSAVVNLVDKPVSASADTPPTEIISNGSLEQVQFINENLKQKESFQNSHTPQSSNDTIGINESFLNSPISRYYGGLHTAGNQRRITYDVWVISLKRDDERKDHFFFFRIPER